MELTATSHFELSDEKQRHFYTDDELALLEQLENGQVATKSHDQVMENLRHKLNLAEK